MKVLIPLAAVAALFLLAFLGAGAGAERVLGVAVPYAALGILVAGLVHRILGWAMVPVPFRIPTTSGQQRSLPWIRNAPLDNPHTRAGVVGRMALEVLCFRSLLLNTRTEMTRDGRLVYGTSLGLWAGALAMHWALLVVLFRHLRFAFRSVPAPVAFVEGADSFLAPGMPAVYLSGALLVAGLLYLLARRVASPQVRYISLAADYFPLFLLLGIGVSGIWMRHLSRTDVAGIKELAVGLATFSPVVPGGLSPLFFGHLFLVSVLLASLPFSKLLHAPGVFFSPTRNMANTNREVRHVNPWDYPVKVHTYDEYEDELREKMISAGLPVERERP